LITWPHWRRTMPESLSDKDYDKLQQALLLIRDTDLWKDVYEDSDFHITQAEYGISQTLKEDWWI
ncbi:hypothetical protein M3M33_17395, partial [Loigolactobacillus coryniformis]|uniref:hypothetical protein n=1 Tax=Loigolactobacillus coryniformis TaxID=1610 RepID=UPI00201AEEAA